MGELGCAKSRRDLIYIPMTYMYVHILCYAKNKDKLIKRDSVQQTTIREGSGKQKIEGT